MSPPVVRPIRFAPELPITARVRDITAAIEQNQVVIVAGDTGSGKTTQLPKICLAMGRARIAVTQPRRIAATSVAARIASELSVELGREVGYQVRFADRTSELTRVKLMTDGILLAELQGDPQLFRYDTIVLDELGLCHGDVRIDVASVNGELSGYEIKRHADTLARRPKQCRN